MHEHLGFPPPSAAPHFPGGLRDRLRLRLFRCLMRSRTAADPAASAVAAADPASDPSCALATRRAAMRSLRGSWGCSGCRTMENSQLAALPSSSSELAEEQEEEQLEEEEEDEEEEEEEPSLLPPLLPLLLLCVLRRWRGVVPRWTLAPWGDRDALRAPPQMLSSVADPPTSSMDTPAPPSRYAPSLPPSTTSMLADATRAPPLFKHPW